MLTPLELANWTALYVATAVCCAIALSLSVPAALYQSLRGPDALAFATVRDRAFALPRLWWRWQKLYFTATPVVLAIVAFFGVRT